MHGMPVGDGGSARPRVKRKLFTFSAVVAALFAADQLVKAASVAYLRGRPPVEVVPDLFQLAYVENRGCAWGMLQGHVWPLAVFAMAAMALLVWKRRSVFPPGKCGVLAEVLLYAGILGNLADRLVRGCVIDMFDFHWHAHHFPVFNVADAFITVAAVLMIVLGFCGKGGGESRGSA